MKLPARKKTGSKVNLRRSECVQNRLHAIGTEYRAEVPKAERSYRRWVEFLYEREPSLVLGGPETTFGRFTASLAVHATKRTAKNPISPKGA